MKRIASNSHITLEGRMFIEERLNEGWKTIEIAKHLCRNRSSIKREIDRNIIFVFPSLFNNSHPCIKWNECPVKEFNCYQKCKNIEINQCPRLISPPHICNACKHKNGCRYVKKYYKAIEANNKYLNSWKQDRIGLRYTDDELIILNTDFYNLVILNKSIYHSLIIINNRGYNFKESTIYRQIKHGRLKLKSYHLPRQRNQKNQKPSKEYKNIESIEGHTYDDYKKYKETHNNVIETQMDTVIGITNANDPVILTLEIVEISFMFIFKLDKKTFDQTLKKLNEFKDYISVETFNKIFEILLTDNGSEFKSVSKIVEAFPDINIYYCHPYSSYEKGSIENNHELLRRIIPKGVSLKTYTQKDYNKIANNINSLYRKKLNGKCPFDLVNDYINLNVLKQLGLEKIIDSNVNLTPFLLGDKNIENIKKYLDYVEISKSNISLNNIEE